MRRILSGPSGIVSTRAQSNRRTDELTRFVAGRRPGTALDLGYARGDDAIWLARRGWTVTGVDVSMLLIAAHGARAPWSWADPDTTFPTADDELAGLALRVGEWRCLFVGIISRTATGPDGQQAEVLDTVVAIKRRQGFLDRKSYT